MPRDTMRFGLFSLVRLFGKDLDSIAVKIVMKFLTYSSECRSFEKNCAS